MFTERQTPWRISALLLTVVFLVGSSTPLTEFDAHAQSCGQCHLTYTTCMAKALISYWRCDATNGWACDEVYSIEVMLCSSVYIYCLFSCGANDD